MDEKWEMMPPPRADIETGQHKIAKREAPFAGVAISKNSPKKETALAVADEFFKNSVSMSPEIDEQARLAAIYTEAKINPSRYISVPAGEDEMRVRVHLHGMLAAFLKGEINMARWAPFAEQLEDKGADEMLDLRKSAYNNARK